MEELTQELKQHIITELNLEDILPEDIKNDAPLFGEGLELDSIDALELVVILENYYGVIIPDEAVGKQVLYSVDTMAAYIVEHTPS